MLLLAKLAPPQIQPPYQQQSFISQNRGKPRKLTKADIGTPSNFKHVTHVGWNAKSGFDLSGEDEALRPFLKKAGVSENQLQDRRTRDFIYDFIQTNNVEEAVRKEKTKPAAPPVPNRNQVRRHLNFLKVPPALTDPDFIFRTKTVIESTNHCIVLLPRLPRYQKTFRNKPQPERDSLLRHCPSALHL